MWNKEKVSAQSTSCGTKQIRSLKSNYEYSTIHMTAHDW